MILVDTSIWIEFFKRKEPIFSELKDLIEGFEILVHEVVFGELLQGCKTKSEEIFILDYWENLNRITSNGSFIEAGKLSFENKYLDKGIGLIDSVLIAQVKKKKIKIWTLDKKITTILSKSEIYTPKSGASHKH
ncbi:MAG: PIN domain-containing protein [Leptospiraceae bacterium]|nr:PIN domain-containing protein [Leptospiraceae bacterium]MCP5493172.1 PIN domain-containing protein [Leptospiraceae bacterium]